MIKLSHKQIQLIMLIVSMVVSLLPILIIAPTWLTLMVVFCFLYSIVQSFSSTPSTFWLFKLLLTLVGIIMLVVTSKEGINYLFFIYSLTLFVGLKALEIEKRRDFLVQVLINLYVVFASLIIALDLWIFVYVVFAITFNFIVLFKIYNPATPIRSLNKVSAKLMLVTLIVTMTLFYVFPRISTPFWQLPSPNQKRTGFGDHLSLGDVKKLVLDDSQAMKIISKKRLEYQPYWRGVALSFYDGLQWQVSKASNTPNIIIPELPSDNTADIEIVMEPTNSPWIFTVGQVTQSIPMMLQIPNVGMVKRSKTKITRQFAYRFNMASKNSRYINPAIMHLNKQYPSYANPRLRRWAKKIAKSHQFKTPEIISVIKREIQQKPFWYTLTPTPIGNNAKQLDTFWFKTREGYCEYYASSVAFVLRVAGIPARIVVGYQGGQWNPIGNYLVIKQSDAHAWIEYWQPSSGWTILDPTGWIPAHRIDDSMLKRMQRLRSKLYDDIFNQQGRHLSLWQKGRYYLESVHFFWQRWLLFYNYETQKQLFQYFSMTKINHWLKQYIYWLILPLAIMIFLPLRRWAQKRPSPYARELAKLKKQYLYMNLNSKPPRTFNDICDELSKRYPMKSEYIRRILEEYEQARYCDIDHDSRPSPDKVIKQIRKAFTRINKK